MNGSDLLTDLARIVVALDRGYEPDLVEPEAQRVVAAFDEASVDQMPLRTYFGHGDAADAMRRFLAADLYRAAGTL